MARRHANGKGCGHLDRVMSKSSGTKEYGHLGGTKVVASENSGNQQSEAKGCTFFSTPRLTCDQAYFAVDMVGKGTPDTIS